MVTAKEIRAGALSSADVVVLPGGSGGTEGTTLGEEGREAIRSFVRRGGGYLGGWILLAVAWSAPITI
jgi:glutamine amidotransferase-like uncharacterized protein